MTRSPRSFRDYQLMATILANRHVELRELGTIVPDANDLQRVYELAGSRAGAAFIKWFEAQPLEMHDIFRMPPGVRQRVEEERAKIARERESFPESSRRALEEMGYISHTSELPASE